VGRLSLPDPPSITLPEAASLAELQAYIHALEKSKGWLDATLVDNCFLMGEEVGELFKAVRLLERGLDAAPPSDTRETLVEDVAFEIVDVLNYLLAIANRLDIDLEDAFRKKNALNQKRSWSS
jgi:NTP pyrophosphatase (non-canonical NTP hydrolase)